MKEWAKKYLVWIALIILSVLGLKYEFQRDSKVKQEIHSTTLKEDVVEKYSARKGVTAIKRTRKTEKGVVTERVADGARDVSLEVLKDGTTRITARTHGFIFEPNLALWTSDSVRLGLDSNVYFYRRWSVSVGAGCSVRDSKTWEAYGAISYTLPIESFSNTSLFAGYGTRGPLAGIKLKF